MGRRAFVAANWKMNGTVRAVDGYASAWTGVPGVDVVLCPPWAYLERAVSAFGRGDIRFGVQNTSAQPPGAYTGEHAAEMARDLGAEFAIVGHSERRGHFGEDDTVVAAKFAATLRVGLTPILCVGETLDERRRGAAASVVLAQLDAVLERCGPGDWQRAVIAYEPVWAIGTGETARPEQAQEMHAAIRTHLSRTNSSLADVTRILYGGSVNAANAESLFAEADIDGGLVGGASLDADEFAEICCAAARHSEQE